MAQRKKKAKKDRDVLAGDRTPVGQLFRAVRRYVNANGGSIVVIGGIYVLEWPGDAAGKFTVAVKCLGRKPNAPGKSAEHTK